jgi:hypothetical protein
MVSFAPAPAPSFAETITDLCSCFWISFAKHGQRAAADDGCKFVQGIEVELLNFLRAGVYLITNTTLPLI